MSTMAKSSFRFHWTISWGITGSSQCTLKVAQGGGDVIHGGCWDYHCVLPLILYVQIASTSCHRQWCTINSWRFYQGKWSQAFLPTPSFYKWPSGKAHPNIQSSDVIVSECICHWLDDHEFLLAYRSMPHVTVSGLKCINKAGLVWPNFESKGLSLKVLCHHTQYMTNTLTCTCMVCVVLVYMYMYVQWVL